MFKVIIAGGRRFNDYELLKKTCDHMLKNKTDIEIVSGKCFQGADKFGEDYAKENNYSVKQFPPDWKRYNLKAGPIRNEEMAKYADALICFWDGISKGTKSMINLAEQYKLKVKVVLYKDKKLS